MVGREMVFKGHVGILNDQLVSLFQCQTCKEITLTAWTDSGTVRCRDCKGL